MNYHNCPVCGAENDISKIVYDEYGIVECDTKCKECGHENYWSYGLYMDTLED